MSEPLVTLRDSDIIFIASKRLEEVARRMMKLQYDSEMERLLTEAIEFTGYLKERRFGDDKEES